MSVKARFYVHSLLKSNTDYVAVTLNPVVRASGLPGTEGNVDWAKYTPSGRIEMNVSKQTGAVQFFEDAMDAGRDIAITFDLAPE